jgi:hypothetical protein
MTPFNLCAIRRVVGGASRYSVHMAAPDTMSDAAATRGAKDERLGRLGAKRLSQFARAVAVQRCRGMILQRLMEPF